MKTKIVLWGTNDKDGKLLVAIELVAADNKIKIYTFSEQIATEEFYNQMMNLWRGGNTVQFPEGHQVIEKELSITEDILPAEIRVDRTDLINRAKTEWHFVVLSSKLHQSYKTELEDFKEKVGKLDAFEPSIWDEMKEFWNKIQAQAREKNLFRGHADELRDMTNGIFESLKGLKKAKNKEYEEMSKNNSNHFFAILEKIDNRIEKGLGLKPIFNELKSIQTDFKNADLTKSDRSKVWKRLDGAFKKVKEKKFGSAGPAKSGLERANRRYDGLLSAIGKMQSSIDRDKKDMGFQNKRIENTDGQLEMQIRQAKMKMIEERVRSKEEKLADMLKTKAELEKKMENEKKREEEKKVKAEIKAQESKVKEKIAKDIEAKKEDIQVDETKLEKAAEQIKESKQPKKKPAVVAPIVAAPDVAAPVVETTQTDTSDQAKDETATTSEPELIDSVAEDIITPDPALETKTAKPKVIVEEEKIEEPGLMEKLAEEKTTPEPTTETESDEPEVIAEEAPAEGDANTDNNGLGKAAAIAGGLGGIAAVTKGENIIDTISDTVGGAVENIVDSVKAVAEGVKDKTEEVIDGVKEDVDEVANEGSESISDIKETVADQPISENDPSVENDLSSEEE